MPVTKWLGAPRKAPSKHYVQDFVDHYMDPTEVTDRIVALSREFPKISQIIDLPYKTNGYRRLAQAQFGTATAGMFYVSSKRTGARAATTSASRSSSPTPPRPRCRSR